MTKNKQYYLLFSVINSAYIIIGEYNQKSCMSQVLNKEILASNSNKYSKH